MLRQEEVSRVVKEVSNLFEVVPDIFLSIKQGVVSYEVVVYTPFINNVGRGVTLKAALDQLKLLNRI